MMNYKLVNYTANIETPHNLFADILEMPTGHTIRHRVPIREARNRCRHLNLDGGFSGWTPAFFLEKFDYSACME